MKQYHKRIAHDRKTARTMTIDQPEGGTVGDAWSVVTGSGIVGCDVDVGHQRIVHQTM